MKSMFIAAIVLAVATSSAFAQSTAIGIGQGTSTANSASKSVAIGGGNAAARGGNAAVRNSGNSQSSVSISSNTPAATTANTTSTINGSTSVKTVPSVFAPGLAAAGIETCLGSVSAGAGWLGGGVTFGTTVTDYGCAARLDARTLWSMGLKKAAVARLCIQTEIYNSMPDVCAQYLPRQRPVYASAGPIVAEPVVTATNKHGPIMLVEGKTGKDRLCDYYDDVQKRCRKWAVIP